MDHGVEIAVFVGTEAALALLGRHAAARHERGLDAPAPVEGRYLLGVADGAGRGENLVPLRAAPGLGLQELHAAVYDCLVADVRQGHAPREPGFLAQVHDLLAGERPLLSLHGERHFGRHGIDPHDVLHVPGVDGVGQGVAVDRLGADGALVAPKRRGRAVDLLRVGERLIDVLPRVGGGMVRLVHQNEVEEVGRKEGQPALQLLHVRHDHVRPAAVLLVHAASLQGHHAGQARVGR